MEKNRKSKTKGNKKEGKKENTNVEEQQEEEEEEEIKFKNKWRKKTEIEKNEKRNKGKKEKKKRQEGGKMNLITYQHRSVKLQFLCCFFPLNFFLCYYIKISVHAKRLVKNVICFSHYIFSSGKQ